ncbi:hypothetical protein Y032_0048g1676 [Ancylostoma ceylanicum]|uniref:Uncharacterized protein n=1 Tax=Ancylostoma ceylanicum TaxID=53326 RepID=A0A016UA76_9BILA|nr:hypothetical protein Y032_0048g1676 [Ancylostoma ceylanicum]
MNSFQLGERWKHCGACYSHFYVLPNVAVRLLLCIHSICVYHRRFQLSRRPAYELESSRKRRNQWYESTSQYITYGMVHDWNNLLRMLAPASGKSLTKNVTENFETTSSIAKPHTACGEH